MNLSDFVLRYRLGEGEWQVFSLPSQEIQIGRDADNHLILDHREVSRHHLQIRFDGAGFLVTDLGSSNGTQLDGITLTPQMPQELRPGQMIQIGDFTLVLARTSEDGAHISRELLPFLLRFRFGAGTWQTFPMEPGEKILGRDPNNDFYLNDSEVSRRHARLQIVDGEIWLTDLGSTNGTQVGGITLEPEQPYRLQLGQPFSIGNFILQLDEPSRFYKAPSAVAGRKQTGLGAAVHTVSRVETTLDAPMPVQALNLMSKERTTIGRSADNDIVLAHPLVSGHHAVIERSQTDFRILDLNSAYGVFVNDRRIVNGMNLKDWDQIRIGEAVFLLSGHDLQQQVIPGIKLEAKNIKKQVSPSLNLLQDISLTINPNELVALVGPKGSGKTTLLNALSGYQPASHGQMLINDINFYQHYDMFRNDVGYVPKEKIVHPQLTPKMALTYATRLFLPSDTTKEERAVNAAKVLENLDLLAIQNVPITQLSDYQVKRVSIGFELLHKPRLLFLDEPAQGLNPSTEYEMFKLLRHLAWQGRTVISIVTAAQNLMLFDKVIILAMDGYLAFYGAPEDALNFFNQYREDHKLREKNMAFEDVYGLLCDEEGGTPQEWRERYLSSHTYYQVFGIDPSLAELQLPNVEPTIPKVEEVARSNPHLSSIKQFTMLSLRNLRVLLHEKWTLAVMVALAPVVGLMEIVWGRSLYSPITGEPVRIIVMWFLGGLSATLVGSLSSYREINKETGIYIHERWAHLKILPYFFSKAWIGILLAIYQAGILLVFRLYLVNPNMPTSTAFFTMYFVIFLTTFTGYMLGLLISALTSNHYQALSLVVAILVLQILFAGALLPLDWIPGGKQISTLMPVRWSYEMLVRITGLGDRLSADPCWTGYTQTERLTISEEVKENCPCMGASIFTKCADFPGVFSPDFYDDTAALALAAPRPVKPIQPTEIPWPTPFPSPTWVPTPTLLPSLTPFPTPGISRGISAYLEKIGNQRKEYQKLVADQFEEYQKEAVDQIENHLQAQAVRDANYIETRQVQAETYIVSLQSYVAEDTEWQESRQNVIRNAEAVISSVYDNYPQVFYGGVAERLIYLVLIQVVLAIAVLLVQKRKFRF